MSLLIWIFLGIGAVLGIFVGVVRALYLDLSGVQFGRKVFQCLAIGTTLLGLVGLLLLANPPPWLQMIIVILATGFL
jgi:hypothetical protein